MTRHRAG